MGLKDFLLGYPRGREIAPGEPVIQSANVTLIAAAPASLNADSLKAIGSIPPAGDEHLILTPSYLVYKTDFEFVEALLQGLQWGSKLWGPSFSGSFWRYVANFVDTEDRSLWIPWGEVQRIGWDCDEIELTWLLGSQVVPHYYYWVELGGGYLWFLQTPVGCGPAEQQYEAMAQALNTL